MPVTTDKMASTTRDTYANNLLLTTSDFTKTQFAMAAASIVLIPFVMNAIYNMYFHPLSRIPGPRLAAITRWWSFYYEIQHAFPDKCREISEQYHTDIIRVAPNRVVIHDASQYDIIYGSGSKFMKDPEFYHAFPSSSGGGSVLTIT